MSNFKDSIIKYTDDLDVFLQFDNFTGKSLNAWMEPLIQSMTNEGAISYLMGSQNGERYRASPLASSLIWMCSAGLLPDNAIEIMQQRLLFLRDNCEPMDKDKGNASKKDEDMEGWSVAEGVSVWSTSMALIALMDDKKIGLVKANLFKTSILWLVKQQNVGEKGWGYQFSANCDQNIIMTSLVLRTISMALLNDNYFLFNENEKHLLELALNNGFQYIKDNVRYSKRKEEAYWCFEGNKNCAATVWTLLALKYMQKLNINPDFKSFFEENVSRGMQFVLANIPNKSDKWNDEQIVCEAGAKYNKQKNYYSFSPTLLLELFQLGVSPYHPKVIGQIRWLINNEDKWKIEHYDKSQTCAFTYAMVISTIVKWSRLVGQVNSRSLLEESKGILVFCVKTITGMPFQPKSGVQLVKTSRIILVWSLSLLLVILAFKGTFFYHNILKQVKSISVLVCGAQHTIIINVISSIIYAFLLGVLAVVSKFVCKLIRRCFK